MATEEIVARKHWFAYLKILLGYGIWFLILLAFLVGVTSNVNVRQPDSGVYAIVAVVILAVMAISAFFFLWSWMDTKRFTWTAEEERLVLRSGWMPWRRSEFGIAYDTIFESYFQFGMIDKLIGSRDITIRRTEGVTSNTVATNMKSGEEISGAINRKIKETKALRYGAPQMVSQMISEAPRVEAGKTQAEQLREIAALKVDGTITAEEFDLMKRKIIQS